MDDIQLLMQIKCTGTKQLTDSNGSTFSYGSYSSFSQSTDPFGGNTALTSSISRSGSKLFKVASSTNSTANSTITLCFWAKFEKFSSWGAHLFYIKGASNYLSIRPGESFIKFYSTSAYSATSSYTSQITHDTLKTNTWYFYELTYNNGTITLFINGKKIGTATCNVSTLSLDTNFQCGTDSAKDNNSDDEFYGSLTDICYIKGIWHTDNYDVPTSYITDKTLRFKKLYIYSKLSNTIYSQKLSSSQPSNYFGIRNNENTLNYIPYGTNKGSIPVKLLKNNAEYYIGGSNYT